MSNITVKDVGATGFETQRVRVRTMDDSGNIPYKGEQGRGSTLSNIRVIGLIAGTGVGIQIGQPDCSVVNGRVKDSYDGISFIGNSYGNAARGTATNCVVRGSANYSFVTSAPGCTLTSCNSLDATVAGFRNTAVNVTYVICDDEGSTLAESHTIVPLKIGGLARLARGWRLHSPPASRPP